MRFEARQIKQIAVTALGLALLATNAITQTNAQDANPSGDLESVVLTGMIWDFTADHPDFQSAWISGLFQGAVEAELDEDGRPVLSDNAPSGTYSSAENFAQWYRDAPGINASQPHQIELTPTGQGSYAFSSRSYFPIDGQLLGNEGDAYYDTTGTPRNFHFTTWLNGQFRYASPDDSFAFVGDDDVWVFFDGKLGVDVGGIHPAEDGAITGAQLAELGLEPGVVYEIDIFHAERRTTGSNFSIITNFDLTREPASPGLAGGG